MKLSTVMPACSAVVGIAMLITADATTYVDEDGRLVDSLLLPIGAIFLFGGLIIGLLSTAVRVLVMRDRSGWPALIVFAAVTVGGGGYLAAAVSYLSERENASVDGMETLGTAGVLAENVPLAWSAVPELLNSGTVGIVLQTHGGQVKLVLKDGSKTFSAEEPETDAIHRLLTECGVPCESILVGME